jgi:hypothetical protein
MVVRGVRSRTKDKAQKKSSLASPKDSAVMIAQIGKKGESFLRLLREKGTKNPQIIGGSERMDKLNIHSENGFKIAVIGDAKTDQRLSQAISADFKKISLDASKRDE